MKIAIEALRRDGGTQPRANINLDTAYEYGEEMKAGAKFPAVIAFYDGTAYWLADGFHRVEGAFSVGINEINCDVHQGTVEDARWYSFSANKDHGLRRTPQDRKRAVDAALSHPYAQRYSDSQIADHVGVHRNTILAHRSTCTNSASQPSSRMGRDGRTTNTENIGKRPQTPDAGTRVTLDRRTEPEAPTPAPAPVTLKPEPEQDDVARSAESIGAAVWAILESSSTPGEIAAHISGQQIDISGWEDARDFLSAVIEKTKRG